MNISGYVYTNKGGRENNEDSVKSFFKDERGIFVLADGLGGHDSGEVASELVCELVFDAFKKIEDVSLYETELPQILENVNDELKKAQAEPNQENMKTTLTALSINGKKGFMCHIGDSRIYHFRNSVIKQKTNDHSVTYMKYLSGDISYKDIYTDEDRSSLLKVLGKDDVKYDASPLDIQEGDAFLLCSDGFWEYVYDEEMLIDLLKSDNPEKWIFNMLLRHAKRVEEGNDNFSVIAVIC